MRNTPSIIPFEWINNNITLSIDLLPIMEEAFSLLNKNEVVIPSIQQIPMQEINSQVCVKSAYYPKYPYYVVKIAGNFPNNRQINEKTSQGCMCLFSSKTGKLDTIIDDSGVLTQLRTAASGALAAYYFAPKKVTKVAVIGAGLQANMQLEALQLVCDYSSVAIYSRTFKRSVELATSFENKLQIKSKAYNSAAKAVENADIIITATSATKPILNAAMINKNKPTLIIAMGADAPTKNELSTDLFSIADRFICDLKSQSLELGELRSVLKDSSVNLSKVEEFSDACIQKKIRKKTDNLIICDLTGVGILDLSIAMYTKKVYHNSASS
ncbi:hypothetical protein [Tenacibaculum sp. C7A-26P2]|uniref:hypothetical protein n=1 Tax=Tenacibaculum sp. C7A-26P2 TaxID=3447504 RepID=UPI003F87DC10